MFDLFLSKTLSSVARLYFCKIKTRIKYDLYYSYKRNFQRKTIKKFFYISGLLGRIWKLIWLYGTLKFAIVLWRNVWDKLYSIVSRFSLRQFCLTDRVSSLLIKRGYLLLYSGECKFTLNTKANIFSVGYENFCYIKIRVVLTLYTSKRFSDTP